MLDVKELMEDVNISDDGKDVATAGYSCLGDAISEVAESACGIYYSDMKDFLLDHIGDVEDKMKELQSYDIFGAVRELQYEEAYNDLCNETDEIKLYFAYNYILDTLGIEKITEEQNNEIEDICTFNDDLDNIESELNILIDNDQEEEDDEEEESEEDEEEETEEDE